MEIHSDCSVQHCALAAECVKKRKLRQASSLHEVDLHGLMLVTMKVLNSYENVNFLQQEPKLLHCNDYRCNFTFTDDAKCGKLIEVC